MVLALALLLVAVALLGLGLAVEGLKVLLIVAVVLFIAGSVVGWVNRSQR